jgi:predicted nuclease of predicted toxin-antitoxin system
MTRLLLDENLSPNLAARLRTRGHDAVHVKDVHLAGAHDAVIMLWAAEQGRTVVTHDGDFVRNLRSQGSTLPSVIKLVDRDRSDAHGVSGTLAQAARLGEVLPRLGHLLRAGAAVTLDVAGLVIQPLPLDRDLHRPGVARERSRAR